MQLGSHGQKYQFIPIRSCLTSWKKYPDLSVMPCNVVIFSLVSELVHLFVYIYGQCIKLLRLLSPSICGYQDHCIPDCQNKIPVEIYYQQKFHLVWCCRMFDFDNYIFSLFLLQVPIPSIMEWELFKVPL